MKITIIFCALLFLPSVHAGHVTGNGGDAIVCRDTKDNVVSAELLDFYESRVERGFAINLMGGDSWEADLNTLFNRLSHYDTYPRSLIEPWRAQFMGEALFLPGITLVDIPDSEHVSFPRGCKVEQVAIQKDPKFTGDKRYTINKDIWDAFDGASRAGLILHELLYRYMLNAKYISPTIDSRAVRFLTSILAADRFDIFTYRAYLQVSGEELGFEYTNINGYLVPIKTVEFDNEGEVRAYAAVLGKDTPVQVANNFTLIAAGGFRLYTELDRATGLRSYRVQLSTLFRTFKLNGIDFNVNHSGAVLVTQDADGNVATISEAAFSWKSPYWPAPRELQCGTVAFARAPDSSVICRDTRTSLTYDAEIEKFSEIVFDGNLKVKSARALLNSNNPKHIADFIFYAGTQKLQSASCSGGVLSDDFLGTSIWNFFYSSTSRFLMCYSGEGSVHVYPNGEIEKGGVRELTFLIDGQPVTARYGFGCGNKTRWTKSPIYFGHENGQPANALIIESNAPEINPGDYITLDQFGKVTSIENSYCSRH